MTETQTQEAPQPQVAEPFRLAPPRGLVKTGFPTDGYWILAGLPKSGKTVTVAGAQGAVILETEQGGADRVEGWIQDIGPDMGKFRKALLAAIKEPTVKIIVVDTLDVILKIGRASC